MKSMMREMFPSWYVPELLVPAVFFVVAAFHLFLPLAQAEDVFGPELAVVGDGKMVRVMQAAPKGEGWWLKLDAYPRVLSGGVRVTVSSSDKILRKEMLGEGRHFALALPPLQGKQLDVYLAHQGGPDGPYKFAVRLDRLPPKGGSDVLGRFVGRTRTIPRLPKFDDLKGLARKNGARLRSIEKRLGLEEKRLTELVGALMSAAACLSRYARPDLAFLILEKTAVEVAAPAELYYFMGTTLEFLPRGDASKVLGCYEKALELLESGKYVGKLLGNDKRELETKIRTMKYLYLEKLLSGMKALLDGGGGAAGKVKELPEKVARLEKMVSEELARIRKLDTARARELERLSSKRPRGARRSSPSRAGAPAAVVPLLPPQDAELARRLLEARRIFARGDHDEAFKRLEAIAGESGVGDAYFEAGELCLRAGRRLEARRYLEKALAAFERGKALGGEKGGRLGGDPRDMLPPLRIRTAVVRNVLARYWASRYREATASSASGKQGDAASTTRARLYLEKAVELCRESVKAVPANGEWKRQLASYTREYMERFGTNP